MNSALNLQQETFIDLKIISEYSDDTFRDFSKTIDNVFYEMVGETLRRDENLLARISPDDVFHLQQIKAILEILHKEFNSNETKNK